MRILSILSVLFFMLSSSFAYGEVKQKNFTKEEIKKMAETKAVIETKFGNIELKCRKTLQKRRSKRWLKQRL